MSARCPVCPKAEMACVGTAGDDAELGARLFQRLRFDVRLSGGLFEVADPLRATRCERQQAGFAVMQQPR